MAGVKLFPKRERKQKKTMSYSSGSEKAEQIVKEEMKTKDMSAYEYHVIQCCKNDEWVLRKWLHKALGRAGFTIYEDGYQTDRIKKDKRYSAVHNMVAIRGNPRVCLVAHTDVCRDHDSSRYSIMGEYSWMADREEENIGTKSQLSSQKVEPVIKVVEHEGQMRRIIQDKDCKLQVGGDDRLGVAIATWIALNTGYDLGLYFPTDEEIGLKSAAACEMEQLRRFELCMQIDRGNHSHQIVLRISNELMCTYSTAVFLLEKAYDLGLPREPVSGLSTDVYALHKKGLIKDAVNMTCGYHNSHGSSASEYIDIQESKDTMRFVSEVVKAYYLGENP
jgi:hypothetical protein